MRPYTITIDTDDPHLFDLLDSVTANYEASMTQHHPVTNEVVERWTKRGEARGGSLSDPTDVGMVIVDEGQNAGPDGIEARLYEQAEQPDPWEEKGATKWEG